MNLQFKTVLIWIIVIYTAIIIFIYGYTDIELSKWLVISSYLGLIILAILTAKKKR